ncbi:hypothetical protein GN958_ATG18933 [Phytophthora infestans]|uniref:PiggyBac transposable element-derived protein domain-containing protein n=1 Tax=Phytophthora infestans TaxID=4787 RepID=A0A8S9TTR5_PHYIN|nr:hypothetical protein GN958_ATG18933 [Phytophthora infestans]
MEVVGDVKAAAKEHKRRENGLKTAQKTPFVPPQQRSANAGYIVFRDKRVVIIAAANGHAATDGANDREVKVSAPKILREAKEEIVICLWQLSTCICNLSDTANHRELIEDIVGSDLSQHMLTRSRRKLLCLLCSIRGDKNRVQYACTRCRKNAAVIDALNAVILTTREMPISKTLSAGVFTCDLGYALADRTEVWTRPLNASKPRQALGERMNLRPLSQNQLGRIGNIQ